MGVEDDSALQAVRQINGRVLLSGELDCDERIGGQGCHSLRSSGRLVSPTARSPGLFGSSELGNCLFHFRFAHALEYSSSKDFAKAVP